MQDLIEQRVISFYDHKKVSNNVIPVHPNNQKLGVYQNSIPQHVKKVVVAKTKKKELQDHF